MANDKIIVQIASPERKFIKIYQDFLYCQLLSSEEKLIFIALKSFIDFSKDSGGTQGEVFPTIETIKKITGMGKKRIINNIKSLCKKGIVTKIQRGLTKSNIYILSDYASMWACDNLMELKEVIDNEGIKKLTPEEHIAELERMGYKVVIKGKKLETTVPAKVSAASSAIINKDNINTTKSQVERYTMEDIKVLYEYDSLTICYPGKQADIDIVFDILYDTLNTQKQTIRVSGEDKPRMVVIGKLMKLQPDDLIYSINKYHEQTERIKNVKAYLLTILYHAKEQSHLDLMNLGHHNGDF